MVYTAEAVQPDVTMGGTRPSLIEKLRHTLAHEIGHSMDLEHDPLDVVVPVDPVEHVADPELPPHERLDGHGHLNARLERLGVRGPLSHFHSCSPDALAHQSEFDDGLRRQNDVTGNRRRQRLQAAHDVDVCQLSDAGFREPDIHREVSGVQIQLASAAVRDHLIRDQRIEAVPSLMRSAFAGEPWGTM